MVVYAQAPTLLTAQYAQQAAEQWGLGAQLYMPLWMTTADVTAFAPRSYVAVDEPLRLYLDGVELLSYRNASAEDGLWCPQGHRPPVEQATATVEDFLRTRGLLDLPYLVDTSGYATSGSVDFLRSIDGRWPLVGHFARATVHPTGEIGYIEYLDLDLGSLGEYSIISAQEAWDLVEARVSDRRVWHSSLQGGPTRSCPQSWAREYGAGQSVDVFGPLGILYPADQAGVPHITMNGLVLVAADLPALAETYHRFTMATGDSETPAHIWGQVQDAGDHLILELEGWECVDRGPYYWSGTVQRRDGLGLLVTEDGLTHVMPDLPQDLADGTRVYVQGSQWNERLEWHHIQEYLLDDPVPLPPASVILASVERVELAYHASAAYGLSQELYPDYGYRSVQPVWRFSGHTDLGVAFEVYVQAVGDDSLIAVSDQ